MSDFAKKKNGVDVPNCFIYILLWFDVIRSSDTYLLLYHEKNAMKMYLREGWTLGPAGWKHDVAYLPTGWSLMNVHKYRLVTGDYFVLFWQVRKPHYGWNNCRSFGIKQVSLSCCISNAHSRWSKKTSFDATFPPARPPTPFDHRLPPLCREGCSADFPDSIKGIHPAEFLYKGNHFWCQTMLFSN